MKAVPFTEELPFAALPTKYTALSLYSGAGGLDLGFAWAGFEGLWANDFLKEAAETYTANLGPHMHHGDILQLELPDFQPDIVLGGPPCQAFSVAGKMDPADPRAGHVFTFMDVVEKYKPRAFVMENVKSLAQNPRFQLIREQLVARAEAMGYHVELFLLNASHYDTPQARERMFLTGGLAGPIHFPQPTTADKVPTVRDAFDKLPRYGEHGNDARCTAIITPAHTPVLRLSPYAGMIFNGAGRPLNLNAPSCTLPASMGGNKTPIIDQRQLDEGGVSWIVNYHKRLSAGQAPVKSVPKYLRRLTVQEASALQTFPKAFRFAGKQSAQFHQIGNAVPPFLAYHVAKAVRLSLEAQS
jgi:DNA (cytosine-5)-methyltransferase 1